MRPRYFWPVLVAGLLLFVLIARAARHVINIGATANDATGDTIRIAFQKVNSNFAELYTTTVTNGSMGAGNGMVKATTNLHFATSSSYTTSLIPYASSSSAMAFAPALFYDPGTSNLTIGSQAAGVSLLHVGLTGLTGSGSGITVGTGFERNQFFSDGSGNAVLQFGGGSGISAPSLTIKGLVSGSPFTAITLRSSGIHDFNNSIRPISIGPSKIVGTDSSTNLFGVTIGSGIAFDGTTLSATGSGGSVTSVGLTVPSWLTVAGSPVTTSGTLAVTAAGSQTANRFLGSPDGSAGAVSLRAITTNDLPVGTATYVLTANGASSPSYQLAPGSDASAPINNFYTTNNYFITGKGNIVVVTQQLTLGYMTNKLLRVDENGVVTNAATADSNGIDLGNSTTSLKLSDGSKAKPGLAFSVQTNLGIARLFDTTLSIVAGASNVADFGSGAFSSPAGLRLNMATASRFATFDGDKVVSSSGTSANLAATLTDETGSGAAVFGTAPTISGGNFLSGKADTLIVTQVVQSAWTTLTMTGSNVSAINLTNGAFMRVDLTNNAFFGAPINFPGTNFASTYQVHILQDSTGGRTVMMTNSAWQVGTDHSTNAIPSITTNANAVSVLTFVTSPFSATKLYLVPTPF